MTVIVLIEPGDEIIITNKEDVYFGQTGIVTSFFTEYGKMYCKFRTALDSNGSGSCSPKDFVKKLEPISFKDIKVGDTVLQRRADYFEKGKTVITDTLIGVTGITTSTFLSGYIVEYPNSTTGQRSFYNTPTGSVVWFLVERPKPKPKLYLEVTRVQLDSLPVHSIVVASESLSLKPQAFKRTINGWTNTYNSEETAQDWPDYYYFKKFVLVHLPE